jgi:hypothetical protein
MSDVDWRIWIWDRLRNSQALLDLLPDEFSIYGAGSLTVAPDDKPFIVIHIGDEFYQMPGISRTIAYIFAHDEPGNYLLIDSTLLTVRNVLCGMGETVGAVYPPPSGGIVAKWNGDGPDQSDQALQTVMRRSTYELLGRNGNA